MCVLSDQNYTTLCTVESTCKDCCETVTVPKKLSAIKPR